MSLNGKYCSLNPGYERQLEKSSQFEKITFDQRNNQSIVDALLKADPALVEGINQSLMNEHRKRRKKQKHRNL